MNRFAMLALLVALCACSDQDGGLADDAAVPATPPDAKVEPEPAAAAEAASSVDPIVNRIWIATDSGDLPGVMRVFLDTGDLIMDSCWETYRLSRWRREGDNAISWTEDAAEIAATTQLKDSDSLVLEIQLRGETRIERYRAGSAPFVCPDIPKQ